jgi:hypothetical protein
MVGQMDLQQMQTPIDGFGQTEFLNQQPHRAQAAVGHAARPLGDVGGGHDRLRAIAQFRFIQAPGDPLLAGLQLTAYLGIHSKSLRGCDVADVDTSETPQKRRGISFFQNLSDKSRAGYAWLRTRAIRSTRW